MVFDTLVKPKDYVPDFQKYGACLHGLYLDGARMNEMGHLKDPFIKTFYIETNYIM